MSTVNRRSLLGGSLAGIAGGLGGLYFERIARAIEPWNVGGAPKFKFSMAAYSYRQFLQGKAQPAMSLEDFVRLCAKFQLDATELTSYYFPKDFTTDYLRDLKGLCFRLGLDVSGTAVGNDFCVPPGEQRDKEIALVKRWIDYAEILGAPVIRIFSGKAGEGQSPEEAHRLAVEGMEQCCEYAGQHGVYLALENHGGLTAQADGLLGLVRDVKSPWFGVNLDSGNFHGANPYAELAQIAPYTLNVQIKLSVRPADQPRQPSDLGRVASILRDVGYRGYIVLEYEEPQNPHDTVAGHLDALRKAFAG